MEAQDEVVNFVPGKNLILTCIVTDGRPRVNISWQIDDSSNMLQISNANFLLWNLSLNFSNFAKSLQHLYTTCSTSEKKIILNKSTWES